MSITNKLLGGLMLLGTLLCSSAGFAKTNIMPLGDSITGSPGCWRAFLWEKLQNGGYTSDLDMVGSLPPQGCSVPHDGNNEGHGGILATNMADQNQLPAWLSATNPNIVLMHLGTNDVWSSRSNQQILNAFTKLVGQMRANNSNMKIIVAKIIPMDSASSCSTCAAGVIALNNSLAAWAAGLSTNASPITLVDQWTGFSATTDTYDGVHPNNAGDKKMADKWYPALVSALGATASSSSRSSAASSAGGSSLVSSSSASVMSGNQVCNWYGTRYPLCVTTASGWGWENQKSCIARATCAAQPAPYGIENLAASSVSVASSSSVAANNPPKAFIDSSVSQIRCGYVVGTVSIGSGTVDPDGDALTYAWSISDYSSTITATGTSTTFTMRPVITYTVTLTVSDGKGGTATATKQLSHSYSDNCIGSSSSSYPGTSSSVATTSSSLPPSSSSVAITSSSRSSSSSSAVAVSNCTYVIASQWGTGFTAAIRIKNNGTTAINSWNVNWQYGDGSKVTSGWNANFSGSNPYSAGNLGWNGTIQAGQTVEFGFQGTKPAGSAVVPVVTGSICQ